MKAKLVLGLVLVASFVVVSNLLSSGRSYTPTGYCQYDRTTGLCSKEVNGTVCYGVFADCTYME